MHRTRPVTLQHLRQYNSLPDTTTPHHVEVGCRGLEQQVALPRDSYLQGYFTDLYDVLRVGPPLYFVVPHIHMDPQEPDINAICSVGGCNDASFVNEVHMLCT